MAGDHLLFSANEYRTGRELWALPLGDAPQPPPPASAPPPPRDVVVYTSAAFSVGWSAGAGDLLYYLVEARRWDETAFAVLATVPASQTFANFLDLERGVPYVFRVRAVNAAGASPPSAEASGVSGSLPADCGTEESALCLGGDRFVAHVFWRDQRTGNHDLGSALPLPGSARSGTFWFFNAANVELIVKVLDGGPVNGYFWTFAGGLTDVEYWLVVDDLERGRRRTYHHRPGDLCGIADTAAFVGPSRAAGRAPSHAAAAAESGGPLDLLGARYRVEVEWRNQRTGGTGAGTPVTGSDNTGYFWFFNDENIELVVKVLDGLPVNGHRWVFYGGLTDVDYTIHVTDLVSTAERTYHHEAGSLCGGADTAAF